MPIIAAAVVFATVFVIFLAFASPESGVRNRLDALWQQPNTQGKEKVRVSLSERLIMPATSSIVSLVRRLMPTAMLEGLQQRLILAGEPMTVNGFITFQVLALAGFTFLPLLMVVAGGFSFDLMVLLMILFFIAVGYLLPQFWLRQQVGQRRNQIIKGLPDAFDLITTCVEAGLGLDAALARVAEKVKGPFAIELRRMLREISLGKMRRHALRELGLAGFVHNYFRTRGMNSPILDSPPMRLSVSSNMSWTAGASSSYSIWAPPSFTLTSASPSEAEPRLKPCFWEPHRRAR